MNVVATRKVVGVAVLAAECRAVRSIEKFSVPLRSSSVSRLGWLCTPQPSLFFGDVDGAP